MRVFITGPLGYIGKPIAEAFCAAGHQVRGLIRREDKAETLRLAGIEPIIGDLALPETYIHAVEQAEVVIHTAFDSSSSAVDVEIAFVDAILNANHRTDTAKAFIYTSGVWVIGSTGPYIADESSPCQPLDLVKWRVGVEEKILSASTKLFRTLIIRPGCVYGGPGGLATLWFSSTLRGYVEVAGDGNNYWAMIHQQDLARAYLLAAEKELSGLVLNVVDNSHYSVIEMAQAVSEAAGIPGKVETTDHEAAKQKYGEMLEGLTINQHISNERAARLLGWHPKHRTFIDGINDYYMAWKTAQTKNY